MSSTNFQSVLESIHTDLQPLAATGSVASYVPELAHVDPKQFGMSLHTVEGDVASVGQADVPFSTQSISKVFALTLAMQLEGDALWQRIGREPSGTSFNSLVQLEHENGIPRNPFINAGALVVTDVLMSHVADASGALLEFVRQRCGNAAVGYDLRVAQSEAAFGHRNRALAHFIKSFGNLRNDTDAVLSSYFHHCSLAMSCTDIARCGLYLANGGVDPTDGSTVLTKSFAKYINSLMLTCGTYDAVGDFAYRVGLPAKSGVGGGILAVMPGQFSVCVWSPGLNRNGNSQVGVQALDWLTTRTGISIF